MTKTILFIHSAGSQGENQGSSCLVSYLKSELSGKYHFRHPLMPDPTSPTYARWKDTFEDVLSLIDGELILIGHSMGGSFLLKYLSEEASEAMPILAVFIVAAPYWGIDNDWPLKDYFLEDDFAKYLSYISQLFLYHSRHEEMVPFKHHQLYSKKLPQAITREIDGNSHLFESGLPELVEDIYQLKNVE